ncbi:uncharacterized protein LOC122850969 [Aphidius gifuensis]|uniref:uncharacterized protein LOC122850969 n=1 Tax=Aphidius gifuensis TaxID=684658 RepID=UPI001CDC8FC4|nr:uncharacterized protein LOC122850969 [Aphidius gifuensis]
MNNFFFGLVIMTINIGYLSAKNLSPLKVDSSAFHLYKSRNELDYILKNLRLQNIDDTKDNQYINFGQNQDGENENLNYLPTSFISIDPKTKVTNDQSDIIIRFARSGAFDIDSLENFRLLSLDIQQLLVLCGDFNNIDSTDIGLTQLCNYITAGLNE